MKLVPWVTEQFKQPAKAHPDACRLLVELVGENSDELRSRPRSSRLWAQGEEITAEHVEEMVLPRGPVAVDADRRLVGAQHRRRLTAAQRMLRARRHAERHRVKLGDHVALVSACRRFAADGIGAAEATKRLKRRSEFPVRKKPSRPPRAGARTAPSQPRSWPACLDVALQGRQRTADEPELERALVEVSR